MDESTTFSRSVRPSALPRPSRLPLLRATTTRTTSPERSASRLGQSVSSSTVTSPVKSQAFNGSLRGRPAAASFLPTPSRPGLQGHSPTKIQTEHRPPLATINRTQAQTGTIRQRDIKPIPAVVVKVEHDFEEQENNWSQNDDSSLLEDTGIVSSSDNSSPLQAKISKRPPRPSLSDRTIKSLAQVPPTPGSNRRRSAFFNPYSPMSTPARPASAMSTISKLSYGSVRQSAASRPTPSSLSRNARGPVGYTPRRSISTGVVPGSARSASTTKRPNPLATSINRPASAAPTLTRSALLRQQATASKIAPNTSRPASALSRSVYGPPAKKIEVRPPSQLSQSGNGARGSSNNSVPKTTNTFKPGASSTLRSQIANARATVRKQHSAGSTNDTIDFDQYKDPFNQKTAEQDGDTLLERRLENARRDGRLNIAAMGLKTIPDEVLTMYDEQAMQRSSLAWNETVDLNYLNAADNEIVEIPDAVFPDMSIEELAQLSEPTSNQFGGLATLDLHGNMLKHIPIGIRRLERLTTLNLSRNNLTNDVFNILTELPYLRHLHLASNDLSRVLPDTLANLDSLETLDLSDNKLVLLPTCIRHLTHLRVLNITSNRFSDLSIDTLATLPHLSEIYAAKNALTGSLFPSTVTSMPSLRILDVSKNSIASLAWASTSGTGSLSLSALMHLNISNNRIVNLPSITTWTSLTNLLAEENSITAFPDGLISLPRLRNVDFASNDLKSVDEQIANMECLELLNLTGNPLRERRFLTMSTDVLKRELARRIGLAEVMGGSGEGVGVSVQNGEIQDDEMF